MPFILRNDILRKANRILHLAPNVVARDSAKNRGPPLATCAFVPTPSCVLSKSEVSGLRPYLR